MKPWHRLPKEAGDAPSLEAFKARLDGALSNLIGLKVALFAAGGWTGWPLKVPSHSNHSVIHSSRCPGPPGSRPKQQQRWGCSILLPQGRRGKPQAPQGRKLRRDRPRGEQSSSPASPRCGCTLCQPGSHRCSQRGSLGAGGCKPPPAKQRPGSWKYRCETSTVAELTWLPR